MEKFIIIWNAGYGDSAEVIEVEDHDTALGIAYDAWKEEAETNADYKAVPYTKEEAVDYGLEEEEDDELVS